MKKPFDVRQVANLLLDFCDQDETAITNLALQKLLYFSHGRSLIQFKRPLVGGYFEAWKFGPVHPLAYKAFQSARDKPITFRATAHNPITNVGRMLEPIADPDVKRLVREIGFQYGRLTPGRLVDISHARNGPWDVIANKARTSVALGLRIPDNITIERFANLKVSVTDTARAGEPNEDTPLT